VTACQPGEAESRLEQRISGGRKRLRQDSDDVEGGREIYGRFVGP
jgi:hypothetical protein